MSEINTIVTKIGNECTTRDVTQTSVQVGQGGCGCDTVCICEADGTCCETFCQCENECYTVMVESQHFTKMRADLVSINADHCYCESDGGIETHSGCSTHSYTILACSTDFDVNDEVFAADINDADSDIDNLVAECDCNTNVCNCVSYCNCETNQTLCGVCGCNTFCFCTSACGPESCTTYCQCESQCTCDADCICDNDCTCDTVCNCEFDDS